jgi:glycosyltransferase involved in cell wall biosynthesis
VNSGREPAPEATDAGGHDRLAASLVFIANSMYASVLSGGDIHTLHMIAGAVHAGYRVRVLCGHGLKAEIEARALPVEIILTDKGLMPPRPWDTVGGQLALLADYIRRTRGTWRALPDIRAEDWVYMNTDFWWDSLPGLWCRARRKLMILGMDCPAWTEIVRRSRPDIKASRLPSIHYWLSQHLALRLFRRCRRKILLYVHPDQRPRLRHLGYTDSELVCVSNGIDVAQADAVPEQQKIYDVAWTGRVHQQKGIEDLLAVLRFLAQGVPNLRAVIIGGAKAALEPRIAALGLAGSVHFSGYVSEAEKFRLLKASRVFLMPSHYESWGIVIGEALACAVPVVAYDVPAYRAVFGEFVRTVPLHDVEALQLECLRCVEAARAGRSCLEARPLAEFKQAHSWQAAQRTFCAAIAALP